MTRKDRSARHSASLVLCVCTLLCSCSSAPAIQASGCRGGERPMRTDTLYFGTQSPVGTVSAADWLDFVEHTVTPRFAGGFTVWPASGVWRSRSGEIVHEESHMLQVVHTPSPADETAIAEIIGAYKLRFAQEAVLRVTDEVCASL